MINIEFEFTMRLIMQKNISLFFLLTCVGSLGAMEQPGEKLLVKVSTKFKNAQTNEEIKKAVHYALKENAINICILGSKMTPLYYAVLISDVDLVRELLRRGAQVEARDYLGRTPLFFVIEWYRPQSSAAVVAELLKNKANIDAQDDQGNTPLHRAKIGLQQIKEYKHRTPEQNLYIEVAQLLVQNGARTDLRNIKGLTADDIN